MRHSRHAVLAFGFVLAAIGPARADDDAKAAQALVDKAIKAHGGADALAKFTGSVGKFKGKFYGMGEAIPMTGEISTQGADRFKMDVEVEAGGQTIRFVIILNGNKGWTRIGDSTTDLDDDKLAETSEQAHAVWVASLAPLSGKGFTLATTGELLVADKPALGVKVSTKGRRDVTLYFDKQTGMLVKSESRAKDEATGQEVTEERFPSEYKDVQGTKKASKITTKRDGKLYVESEVTDLQLVDKLGAEVFAKP